MKLALLLGLLVPVLACGDDDTGVGGGPSGGAPANGCTADPFACAAGTTCWVLSDQKSFDCLPVGPGASAEECVNTAGQATCGEGLTCLQLAAATEGVCTPYCDQDHPCESGVACAQISLAGSIYGACEPPAEGGAGGGGGG
jgi:hypothetical protein